MNEKIYDNTWAAGFAASIVVSGLLICAIFLGEYNRTISNLNNYSDNNPTQVQATERQSPDGLKLVIDNSTINADNSTR